MKLTPVVWLVRLGSMTMHDADFEKEDKFDY